MFYSLQNLVGVFHVAFQLFLRHITLSSIDGQAHQEEIAMTALDIIHLSQPPMVESKRIIPMYLSGNIPFLFCFIALDNNLLIPFWICDFRFFSRHFGRSEPLLDIHPICGLDRITVHIG